MSQKSDRTHHRPTINILKLIQQLKMGNSTGRSW